MKKKILVHEKASKKFMPRANCPSPSLPPPSNGPPEIPLLSYVPGGTATVFLGILPLPLTPGSKYEIL